jgi:hypothetical protein
MPLPDSVTACRGQNCMLLQSPRWPAILAQALGGLFLRQKVAIRVLLRPVVLTDELAVEIGRNRINGEHLRSIMQPDPTTQRIEARTWALRTASGNTRQTMEAEKFSVAQQWALK